MADTTDATNRPLLAFAQRLSSIAGSLDDYEYSNHKALEPAQQKVIGDTADQLRSAADNLADMDMESIISKIGPDVKQLQDVADKMTVDLKTLDDVQKALQMAGAACQVVTAIAVGGTNPAAVTSAISAVLSLLSTAPPNGSQKSAN